MRKSKELHAAANPGAFSSGAAPLPQPPLASSILASGSRNDLTSLPSGFLATANPLPPPPRQPIKATHEYLPSLRPRIVTQEDDQVSCGVSQDDTRIRNLSAAKSPESGHSSSSCFEE